MPEPDLLEFLRARLDEDEQAARAATAGPWYVTEYAYEDDAGCEASIGTDLTSAYGRSDVVMGGYEGGGVVELADARHIARHDPARVLAEVSAKRRILSWHDGQRDATTPWGKPVVICHCGYDLPCSTLRFLALPYADHEDYRPEWAPDA